MRLIKETWVPVIRIIVVAAILFALFTLVSMSLSKSGPSMLATIFG